MRKRIDISWWWRYQVFNRDSTFPRYYPVPNVWPLPALCSGEYETFYFWINAYLYLVCTLLRFAADMRGQKMAGEVRCCDLWVKLKASRTPDTPPTQHQGLEVPTVALPVPLWWSTRMWVMVGCGSKNKALFYICGMCWPAFCFDPVAMFFRVMQHSEDCFMFKRGTHRKTPTDYSVNKWLLRRKRLQR